MSVNFFSGLLGHGDGLLYRLLAQRKEALLFFRRNCVISLELIEKEHFQWIFM